MNHLCSFKIYSDLVIACTAPNYLPKDEGTLIHSSFKRDVFTIKNANVVDNNLSGHLAEFFMSYSSFINKGSALFSNSTRFDECFKRFSF